MQASDSTDSISIDPGNETSFGSQNSLGSSSLPSDSQLSQSQSQPVIVSDSDSKADPTSTSISTSFSTSQDPPPTQSNVDQQAKVQSSQSNSFPSSTAGRLAQDSLSAQIQGLVLYDLTNKPGSHLAFSPHTLKTVLDLKLLGIGYERERLTFSQIRGELSQKVAENVTVPTLELNDGTHVIESWDIAEYLESQHPKGVLLFPSTSSKVFAQFLNVYGKQVLGPNLSPLCMPSISKILDEGSKDYFINKKVGAAKIEKCLKFSTEERNHHIEGAIKALSIIDTALATRDAVYDPDASPEEIKRRRTKGGNLGSSNYDDAKANEMPRKWLCKGEQPSHADFVVFGWYAFTRAAGPEISKQIWQNSDNPLVRTWVNNMLEWAGKEITDDFI